MVMIREARPGQAETNEVKRLADKILPVCDKNRQTIIELALILCYATVVDSGAKAFREGDLRPYRFRLFVERASKGMAEAYKEVAELSDDDLRLTLTPPASPSKQ